MYMTRKNFTQYVCDRCGLTTGFIGEWDEETFKKVVKMGWIISSTKVICPICAGKEADEKWRGKREAFKDD